MINLFSILWNPNVCSFITFYQCSKCKAFVSHQCKCSCILLDVTDNLKGHKINAEMGDYFLRSCHGIQDTRPVITVLL